MLQIAINFIIPIVILTQFSGEAQLGPIKSLLLALAFPIGLELYSLRSNRRPNVLSMISIGGILITGAIALLGLSENWLAVRRTVPYAAAGAAFLISALFKRPLLGALLPYLLDMEEVRARALEKHAAGQLERRIARANYLTGILFMILAIASYFATLWVIASPGGSPGFNQEYARLRLISLPAITLPMVIGLTAVLYYLVHSMEKLTGLEFDSILKKK